MREYSTDGGEFIDGGMMVPATLVGIEAAYCFYSGPRSALDRHVHILGLLGRPEFIGAQAGVATLWYQALLDVFMVSLASLTHATALVGTGGVTAAEFLPRATELLADLPSFLGNDAEQVDTQTYKDEGASLAMMSAGIDHITTASEDAGIDAGLPASVRTLYRRAMGMGHAKDSSTSIYEAIVAFELDEGAA